MGPGPARSRARRLLPLVALGVVLVGFFALRLDRYVSFATLRDNRAALSAFVQANELLAGLLFVTGYALAVAASLPVASVLSIGAGFLFGTVIGAICVVSGATLGATALFLAARTALGDSLRQRAGRLGARLIDELSRNAFSYLLVLRLVPLFPFWLVNLVPAAAGVPLGTYMLATFLGVMPASVVFVSVGSGVGAVFDRGGTPDLSSIFSAQILLPLLGLAALALIPVIYRHWKARRDGQGRPA